MALMLLAVLGVIFATSGRSLLSGPSLWLVFMTLGFAAVIAMVSALRFAWPHLTLSGEQLRAGGTAVEF
jgi:hypothetical protein